MKQLVSLMKSNGKTTFLEVVRYSEVEGLESARLASECGFDYLMGTVFFKSIADYMQNASTIYSPFCGKVYGSPSVLDGSIEEIIDHARSIYDYGVKSIDLLAYRYSGDADLLIREIINKIDKQVILAGSINDWDRLHDVLGYNPWGFTIGSAFFDARFVPGQDFGSNMMAVYNKIQNNGS